MLPKTPQIRKFGLWNLAKGSVKTFIALEAAAFVASFGIYYRMNTNREFRFYIRENFPFMLDYYYKLGEYIGNNDIRQIDATIWKQQKKSD